MMENCTVSNVKPGHPFNDRCGQPLLTKKVLLSSKEFVL